MIQFSYTNSTDHVVDEALIQRALNRASTQLGAIGDRAITIEFVSLSESQDLNKRLRGKDKPTDIISISAHESHVGEQIITETADGGITLQLKKHQEIENKWPVIGQLVICLPVVEENARRAGQPPERELEWVIEHGVYHVMGYHHDDDH